MSHDDGEKQYDASEQKLRRARDQGDIVRSVETNSALVYLAFFLVLGFISNLAVPAWQNVAARALGSEYWPTERGQSVYDLARSLGGWTALFTLGSLAVMGAFLFVGMLVQRTIIFTPTKLVPDIKRINPLVNAGQKFGKVGIISFAISAGKAILVAFGGWILFRSLLIMLENSGLMSDFQWVWGISVILERVVMLALGVSVLFGGIDLIWRRFDYMRRNRMTRKEILDEHKESDGDPYMKANRRQKGVDMVMNRVLDEVAKADVIMVNPTHYAVALEWKRGSGRAPVCVAKGVGEVARRIRERGHDRNIPIWSDPPSTRAIYAVVEIGHEIHKEHFAPVAIAIRFAEAMSRKARDGWDFSSFGSEKGIR